MFGQMKEMAGQFQMLQRLMQDEHFKAFVSHPKTQELFRDPEFKEVAKTRDLPKILAHPKFAPLMKDPELAGLIAKIGASGVLQKKEA
jgi:hypothetical protein